MRGSVVKRGRTWSYVVDVGRDPVTGRRRQRWRGGFATKAEAERVLAVQVAGAGVTSGDEAAAVRVDAYLDEWWAPATVCSQCAAVRVAWRRHQLGRFNGCSNLDRCSRQSGVSTLRVIEMSSNDVPSTRKRSGVRPISSKPKR